MTDISKTVMDAIREKHRYACVWVAEGDREIARVEKKLAVIKERRDAAMVTRTQFGGFLLANGVPLEELDKDRDDVDNCLGEYRVGKPDKV